MNLEGHSKRFNTRWINIETGECGKSLTVEGGGVLEVLAPDMSGVVCCDQVKGAIWAPETDDELCGLLKT